MINSSSLSPTTDSFFLLDPDPSRERHLDPILPRWQFSSKTWDLFVSLKAAGCNHSHLQDWTVFGLILYKSQYTKNMYSSCILATFSVYHNGFKASKNHAHGHSSLLGNGWSQVNHHDANVAWAFASDVQICRGKPLDGLETQRRSTEIENVSKRRNNKVYPPEN